MADRNERTSGHIGEFYTRDGARQRLRTDRKRVNPDSGFVRPECRPTHGPRVVGICELAKGQRGLAVRKEEDQFERLKIKDVMTADVTAFLEKDDLIQVIEGLTEHRFGAVLIRNDAGKAVGVVSKSDLIVAYKHGVTVDARAADVMSSPVVSSDADTALADAIRQMLLKDVQRLFVHGQDPGQIAGILSLSDAARFRSGSCRACSPSRFLQA